MEEQIELIIDDSWIDELYQWADKYDIPDLQYAEPELDDDGSIFCEGYWFGLPRDKEALRKLEVLNLDGYIKSDIPNQIRFLTNLKELSLAEGPNAWWSVEDADKDHDCITEIPEWISDLENLEVLNLSDNAISYVPPRLAKLSKLRKLYLGCNRIQFITEDLNRLINLEVLWLQLNQTALLTGAIKSLESLKELWIDGLEGSDHGPIERCPEGLKWPVDDGYIIRHIRYEVHGFEESGKKNLGEIIDLMGLSK